MTHPTAAEIVQWYDIVKHYPPAERDKIFKTVTTNLYQQMLPVLNANARRHNLRHASAQDDN